jgi:hypothetical protein
MKIPGVKIVDSEDRRQWKLGIKYRGFIDGKVSLGKRWRKEKSKKKSRRVDKVLLDKWVV